MPKISGTVTPGWYSVDQPFNITHVNFWNAGLFRDDGTENRDAELRSRSPASFLVVLWICVRVRTNRSKTASRDGNGKSVWKAGGSCSGFHA